MPEIVNFTYEGLHMGVGILNTQDVVRRNKDSKDIYLRFSNHEGKGTI